MHPTIWALLPFALVIPISIMTRQVIPGLVVGLLTGAYLISHSLIGGIDVSLQYLYKELSVAGNLHLVVFLYLFGSFVGLVRITGGVSGFSEWLKPRIQSKRGAYAVTWASAIATFMAPDFRIITVAPIMRSMISRLNLRQDQIAYAIDVTSTPLISLIPVGTAFVGYMVGLIAITTKHIGVNIGAFPLFLQTIPLNFFSIAILLIGAYLSFFRWSGEKNGQKVDRTFISSVHRHPQFGVEAGEIEHQSDTTDHVQDPLESMSQKALPQALHLVIPIILLITLTLVLTWWNGHFTATSVFQAFIKADAARAMLQAIMITLLLSSVLYMVRRVPISRLMYGVVAGGNEMMPVIVLLVLVWAVSGVSADLGFSQYISHSLGSFVPRLLVPPALFLLGSVISYFIGSSFGTWGILMPLGFSLAVSTHASLLLTAAAVFASGTLGGFASPLSDNTVAMATVMKLPVMGFARSLLKTTLIAGGIATVGYAAAGIVM